MLQISIAFCVASIVLAQTPCKESGPMVLFNEGRRIIEWNVGDSMGASREKLEQGMVKIREALDQGYEGKMEAYRLMIDAQRSIAVIYAEEGSDDKKQSLIFLKNLYEEAFEIDPDNVGLLYDAASLAPGGKSEEEIFRQILEIDPQFSPARFALGQLLILEGKDKVTGEAMMREAYRNSEGRVKEFRGRRLRAYLIQEGRHAEARKILKEIKDLPLE